MGLHRSIEDSKESPGKIFEPFYTFPLLSSSKRRIAIHAFPVDLTLHFLYNPSVLHSRRVCMDNHKLLVAAVCLLCLVACAGHRQGEHHPRRTGTNNYTPVYGAGIVVKEVEERLVIDAFDVDSPALAAGMLTGDVIAAVNDRVLPYGEFLKFMRMSSDEAVRFLIKRNGHRLSFTVTPKLYFMSPPSAHRIYELSVIGGQRVNLAVVVTDVRNNAGKTSFFLQEDMSRQIRRDIENYTLNNMPFQARVSFVDGPLLDGIVEEYRLNMAGLTSEEGRTKIRSTTGATHLFAVTFERNPTGLQGGEQFEDTVAARLMEVASGAVLAVDQSTSPSK